MADIPAFCYNCGNIFPSGFALSGSAKSWNYGCQSQCPRCGNMAVIADGSYEAAGDALKVIDGSEFTHAVVAAFNDLLHQARAGKLDGEQLEKAASKLDPKLGEAIATARSSGATLPVVALLLMATLHSCQLKIDAKVDLNRALDQVIGLVDRPKDNVQRAANEQKAGDARHAGKDTKTKSEEILHGGMTPKQR